MIKNNKYKSKFTAIIQARIASIRLPGKAMMPLKDLPMLYHVIERTKLIKGIDKVVLATSHGEENIKLLELAESMNIETFVGSHDNVLERYYMASEKFGGDYIIRVTGDNPFTDPDYASLAMGIADESKADLCSIPNLPLGTAVEVIKKEALDMAYKMSDKQYHFEHVTPFLKEHTELFQIERHPITINNPFQNLRLTVDTMEDYNLADIIYDKLYDGQPMSLHSIIDFLIINPELVNINIKVKHRPMTHSSNGA